MKVSPVHLRRPPAPGSAGFSLVEVCLAVGIVAFALLPLVGLLSVGLDSYRRSNMRGRAAQAVSQIASCIRLSRPVIDPGTGKPTGVYAAAGPMDNANIIQATPADGVTPPMHWSLGTSGWSYTVYFDDSGQIVTAGANPTMVACVVLTAPTSGFGPGTARICVAWPALAPPKYDSSKGTVTFATPQGHEESTISFITNPP